MQWLLDWGTKIWSAISLVAIVGLALKMLKDKRERELHPLLVEEQKQKVDLAIAETAARAVELHKSTAEEALRKLQDREVQLKATQQQLETSLKEFSSQLGNKQSFSEKRALIGIRIAWGLPKPILDKMHVYVTRAVQLVDSLAGSRTEKALKIAGGGADGEQDGEAIDHTLALIFFLLETIEFQSAYIKQIAPTVAGWFFQSMGKRAADELTIEASYEKFLERMSPGMKAALPSNVLEIFDPSWMDEMREDLNAQPISLKDMLASKSPTAPGITRPAESSPPGSGANGPDEPERPPE